MKPEELFRKKIDVHFEKHFHVYREVTSNCKKGRLDYILKCKSSNAWFGIEVKKNQQETHDRLRGNDWGKFLKQAENYTKMSFNSRFPEMPDKIMVFITPALTTFFKEVKVNDFIKSGHKIYYCVNHDETNDHSNINSLISSGFSVGEVRKFKNCYGNYFMFIFQNKEIWHSQKGVHEVNYKFYTDKL